MKTLKLVLVLPVVLLLAGWSGETPQDTLDAAFKELCKSGDPLAIRVYMANPELFDELASQVDTIKQEDPSLWEQIKADTRLECAKARAVELRDVDIRGDEATVYFVQADGEEAEDRFVRRDGKWKLIIEL